MARSHSIHPTHHIAPATARSASRTLLHAAKTSAALLAAAMVASAAAIDAAGSTLLVLVLVRAGDCVLLTLGAGGSSRATSMRVIQGSTFGGTTVPGARQAPVMRNAAG